MPQQSAASGPKELREGWHSRTISEIVALLSFLNALIQVEVHKRQQQGGDIEVTMKRGKRRINIEVQQDVSGKNWPNTVKTWSKRHDLYTFIVLTEPFVERLRSTIVKYPFFKRENVFLISEAQLSELVATIAALVIGRSAGAI
jgi:hypothetical protein